MLAADPLDGAQPVVGPDESGPSGSAGVRRGGRGRIPGGRRRSQRGGLYQTADWLA